MGLLDRFRGGRGRSRSGAREGASEVRALADWARSRRGVEAFIEPKTTVTDVTAVLVAVDGEWTRRIVGERGARKLADALKIPVYDVNKTGYPQRMRDFDARRRIEQRRAREAEFDE
ncbi:oxidoreductase [Nocardia mangyaensis]|uniref:Oxidoreductase n=1 Tax=Nocardia mangyaensis TaxID=2213200 RepID=A0A1J0VPS2_9NOCA|nr:oxidoreductase [Nocardia mangyaensis]APE34035.1 oxidoreductase [Nocardia mangyaensis]MDO3650929.1 oxidoreductase [Nocardia mangyaensis]